MRKDQTVIGLGKMKASSDENEMLVTYSLGSCVGLTLYDPVAGVGGLLHCMLPLSKGSPDKAEKQPCLFADTGVMELLTAVFELGASRKNLIAKVAGAAKLNEEVKMYNIGERNYTIVRKILWKNSILIAGEDVGGSEARTMRLEMKTGQTMVKSPKAITAL